MTHARFAQVIARLASFSAKWAADALDLAQYDPEKETQRESVERFIKQARERLDWLEKELNDA